MRVGRGTLKSFGGGLKNGQLLARAGREFDVLLTVDQGLQFQQNLRSADLAIVVLTAASNDIEDLRPLMPEVRQRLSTLRAGDILKLPA